MVKLNKNSLGGLLACRFAVFLVCLFVSWLLPAPLGGGGISYAGQLLFDGVPVDITTTANEDLIIVPGAGGNTQIGDATGTNTNATSNDDLHITGILEVDGKAYFDSAATFASSFNPSADSTADLGSSTLAWRYIYVDTISGYNNALALNPASGYSLTGLVTKNTATGNEVAYDLAATINKATSGNYTGLKLDVTETSAPGNADKLLDLLVGGVSRFQVYNGDNSANYGLVSIGRDDWDGSTAGFFAGSANGTQLAINAITGFTGNLVDAQVAGTSMFSVDANGNVTAAGTITGAGSALSGTTANTFEIDTDDSSTTPTLTFGANVAAVPHILTQVGNLHIEPAGATVINDGTIGTAPAYATATGELYVENDFETRGKSYYFDDILIKDGKSIAVLNNTDPGTADYGHSIILDQTNNVMYFKEWTTFTWTNTSPAPDVDIMTLTPTTGLTVLNDDASNNSVEDILAIRHTTTGVSAAGIGTGLSFHVEDAGDTEEQGSIDTVLTTVTNNAENADMVFSLNNAGTIKEHMRLVSGGDLWLEGATDDGFEVIFDITDPTADRTITIPNADVNLGNTHSQNTDTGTSGTDFKIGNASDAGAVNVSLTFGNTNSETITFTGAGTDNFAFSDLIEAAGLTLDANTNLTLSSGTGVYSQTYTGAVTDAFGITADSVTTADAIEISADALSTGNAINISSTSTAGNSYKLINLASSGANAVAAMGRYGVYSAMTGTGATSTNYAGYFSASGATTNYSVYATGNPTADVGNIYSENTGNEGVAGAFVATATGVGSNAKGIYVRNDGRGDVAAHIETNNTLATAQTLYITSSSTQSPDVVAIVPTGAMAGGNGLTITNTSTTNDARGMYLRNDGDGAVGAHMEINNTANASQVIYALTNGTGYDASFIRNNTSTNTTDTAIELKHTVSTAATGGADGIGAALIFNNETSTDGTEHATAKIAGVLTTAAAATSKGEMVFSYASVNTFKEGMRLLSTGNLQFEGSTDDGFETTFSITEPTADRTITIPNADVNLGYISTSAATTAGTILRADGTNWVATTATYPATTTANQILYSSAASTIGEITTANSGVLVTSGVGVPSIATDIPTAVTIGAAYIYRVGGTDVATADGGTGLSTIGTANQVLGVNSGATGLEYKTVSGTANQVTVAHAANTITLSTPQDIATASTPQFARMGLGAAADATNILTVTSASTTADSKGTNVSHTGAIVGTGYAGYYSKTGASTTNVGIYATASGATNNYAGIFDSGRVGVGDTTPDAIFDIDNTSASVDTFGITHSASADGINAVEIAITQQDDADAADTNTGITITPTSSSLDADTFIGINIGNITAGTATENAIRIGTGWDRGINFLDETGTKIDFGSNAAKAKWMGIDGSWYHSFTNDTGFRFYISADQTGWGTQKMQIDTDSIDAAVDILVGSVATNRWLKMWGNISFEENDDYIGTYNAGTITLGNLQNTTTATTINLGRSSSTADIVVFNVGYKVPLAAKTGAYTATTSDMVITGDATTAAFSITLPAAAGNTGRSYTIKKIDASANAVTVDPNAAETIDGAATYALSTQWKYVTAVSDGTNWIITANN